MDPPFDRRALERRNRLDAADAVAEARRLSPEGRVRAALELTRLCYRLAQAGGTDTAEYERRRFLRKARRLAGPLRLLQG